MELILLRHGIPVEPERWSGSEPTRPLTPSGRAQTIQVIEALSRSGRLNVDAIWSSPFARCDQTARVAAEILSLPVEISPALASGLDLLLSLPRAKGTPTHWPQRLLCVGHSPDLGILIDELTGTGTGSQQYGLGRCGLAQLSGEFAEGAMKLKWLLTAEQAIAGKAGIVP